MEHADEVLPFWKVDRRLPTDRRIDLADERGGHRDPRDASHVRRGHEARQVGRRATADRHERRAAFEPKGTPEPLRVRERLGRLPTWHRMRRGDPVELDDPLVGDDCVALHLGMRAEPDTRRREDCTIEVTGASVRCVGVERRPLLEQRG